MIDPSMFQRVHNTLNFSNFVAELLRIKGDVVSLSKHPFFFGVAEVKVAPMVFKYRKQPIQVKALLSLRWYGFGTHYAVTDTNIHHVDFWAMTCYSKELLSDAPDTFRRLAAQSPEYGFDEAKNLLCGDNLIYGRKMVYPTMNGVTVADWLPMLMDDPLCVDYFTDTVRYWLNCKDIKTRPFSQLPFFKGWIECDQDEYGIHLVKVLLPDRTVFCRIKPTDKREHITALLNTVVSNKYLFL